MTIRCLKLFRRYGTYFWGLFSFISEFIILPLCVFRPSQKFWSRKDWKKMRRNMTKDLCWNSDMLRLSVNWTAAVPSAASTRRRRVPNVLLSYEALATPSCHLPGSPCLLCAKWALPSYPFLRQRSEWRGWWRTCLETAAWRSVLWFRTSWGSRERRWSPIAWPLLYSCCRICVSSSVRLKRSFWNVESWNLQ